ncbi:hypothetical protein FP365_27345 [Klebsiella michiganensis]|nr:hypothetical protein [Klebsiella michiganensis]NCB59161.1 hypothetical protein [Gammaproteobacteria bacterium]
MIGIRFRRWPRSHKSAGYGSGQASSSTGYSPYGFPFVGRSCDLDFSGYVYPAAYARLALR